MKALRLFLPMVFFSALALISCTKEKPQIEGFGDKPVYFHSSIKGLQTRATDTDFELNDPIGIFMKTAGGTLTTGNALQSNKKYLADGSGIFNPASEDDKLYFPQDGSEVDFIAYFNYRKNLNGLNFPVDVSDQTDRQTLDLLYSSNAQNLTAESTEVKLEFYHVMSKLVLNITDENSGGLAGLRVIIDGLPLEAEFSLAEADYTVDAESIAQLEMVVNESAADKAASEAILIPTTGQSGVSVSFWIPGQTRYHVWNLENDLVLKSGKRHTYNITLQEDGSVEVTNPEGEIGDWGNENEGNIELQPEVGGDGTQSSPFTVDQIGHNIGESSVWVRGYVVGTASVTRSGNDYSNVAIAAKPNETDITKWAVVELPEGEIRDALNLIDNEDLIGEQIKVQGDIMDAISAVAVITEVIAQEGGKGSGSGTPVEFFRETFGDPYGDTLESVGAYKNFDMTSKGYKYTGDNGSNINIRYTNSFNPHLWVGMSDTATFKITGIPEGYTNMQITYDMVSDMSSVNLSGLRIKSNGVDVSGLPSGKTSGTKAGDYVTVSVDLPDYTTELIFYCINGSGGTGYRVDNIIIKGVK